MAKKIRLRKLVRRDDVAAVLAAVAVARTLSSTRRAGS